MKKMAGILLIGVGLVMAAAGVYTVGRGLDARTQVRQELVAQRITTPADASIPNARVTDAATAAAMAEIVDVHARKATGGRTFGEMGRFVADDGRPEGTSVEAEARRGPDGQPVRNPLRTVAFEASAVRTGLYTSVMALNISELVVGIGALVLTLGVVFGGMGIALSGLRLPVGDRRLAPIPATAAAA